MTWADLRLRDGYHGAINWEVLDMVDLLIRDLDPAVHRELKRRAEEERLSLQAYVSRVLGEHAARQSMSHWLRRLDELPRHPEVVGADVLREARDDLP